MEELDICKMYKRVINFWYWFHCQLGHYAWCYHRSCVQCVEEVSLCVSSRAKGVNVGCIKRGSLWRKVSLSLLLLFFPALPSHSPTSATAAFNSWLLQHANAMLTILSLLLYSSSTSYTLMVQMSIPVYRLYPNPTTKEPTSSVLYLSLNCQWNELSCLFSRYLVRFWHAGLVSKALSYMCRRCIYSEIPLVPGWPVNSSCDQQIVTEVRIAYYNIGNISLTLWVGDSSLQDSWDTTSQFLPRMISKEWAIYDTCDVIKAVWQVFYRERCLDASIHMDVFI